MNDSVGYTVTVTVARKTVRISGSLENIFIIHYIYSGETSGLFWRASPPQKSHLNTV